jgi:ABC-type sugar transport system ATPase subunit
MRDGTVVATTATADLTIDALIFQMLGEAPHRIRRRTGNAAEDAADVVTVSRLSVPGRFDDFSIALKPGLVYALAGQLGSGASDVLRAAAGLVPAVAGDIKVGGVSVRLGHPIAAVRAGIAFVSNDRKSEGLFLDKPISWNLLATRLSGVTRWGVLDRRRWSAALTRLVALCGLDGRRAGDSVRSLSGGNQQKVFVGRGLGRSDVRVLLLDDPTRGVDVGGRAAIHVLLRDAADNGMAVLFNSTDLEELLDLADVVVTMHKGVVVRRHDGAVAGTVLLREMTHGVAEGGTPAATPTKERL